MSTTGTDFLELLQADCAAILKATPGLEDVSIMIEDEGDMENKVLRALAPMQGGSSGKIGCVAVVLLPTVTQAESNMPGPPLVTQVQVQVIEQCVVNRAADTGTSIRSSDGALRVLNALHLRGLAYAALYAAPSNPIEPVDVKKGYLSHYATFICQFGALTGPLKVRQVSAVMQEVEEEELLALTCATDGATIYYTTDGTYPTPTNGTAYTTPIPDLAVDTVVRAAAYLTDYSPSDLTEVIITA